MIAATDEDGRPVHIEIRIAKEGGVLRGLLDCLAAQHRSQAAREVVEPDSLAPLLSWRMERDDGMALKS